MAEKVVSLKRLRVVTVKPFQEWFLLVEVGSGDCFQIYRETIYPTDQEMDIRNDLGNAMIAMGESLKRSHGHPLVSVLLDGKVLVQGEDEWPRKN